MAQQGKTNDREATGPESSMALDDSDIESIKAPDQLNMTIPMTGAVMSPFAAQLTAQLPRPVIAAEPDDEKPSKSGYPMRPS